MHTYALSWIIYHDNYENQNFVLYTWIHAYIQTKYQFICYLGVRRLLGWGGLGTRPDRRRLRSHKDQKACSIRSTYIQTYIHIHYSNLIHKHWKRKYNESCAATVLYMGSLTVGAAAASFATDAYIYIHTGQI